MLTYGSSAGDTKNPRVSSIRFNDLTELTSASQFQDIHVRKRLRSDNNSYFGRDVIISGDLYVSGQLGLTEGQIPDTSKIYVDQQLLTLHSLLGWNASTTTWTHSGKPNIAVNSLDYRVENTYTKAQIDSKIDHTNAIIYYSGAGTNQFQSSTEPSSVIPDGNSFVIPTPPENGHTTYLRILNSNYAQGKILTSDNFGNATWQTPGATSSTIQSIETSLGVSQIPTFTLKDTLVVDNPVLQFYPLINHSDYHFYQAKDCVIQSTKTLAITVSGDHTSRPAGIRLSSDENGALELYGGWKFHTDNNVTWTRDGENYTGTHSGSNIRIEKHGVRILHSHEQSSATRLYGRVHLLKKSLGVPAYNKNTQTIDCELIVGEVANPATFRVYGESQLSLLKLNTSTTPVTGRVWTCIHSDGTGAWEVPAASSTISSFTNNVTFSSSLTVSENHANEIDFECEGHTQLKTLYVTNDLETEDIHIEGGMRSFNQGTYTVTPIDPLSFSDSNPSSSVADLLLEENITNSAGNAISETGINYDDGVEYYANSQIIPVYNVSTTSDFFGSIHFMIPIFLQHDWAFRDAIGSTDQNQRRNFTSFIYRIFSYQIIVRNVSTLETETLTVNRSQMKENTATQLMHYRKNEAFKPDHLNGPNFIKQSDQDPDCTQLHSHTIKVDSLPFTFHPKVKSSAANYQISIKLSVGFILQHQRLTNHCRNHVLNKWPMFTFIPRIHHQRIFQIAYITPSLNQRSSSYRFLADTDFQVNLNGVDSTSVFITTPNWSTRRYDPNPVYLSQIANFFHGQAFRYVMFNYLNFIYGTTIITKGSRYFLGTEGEQSEINYYSPTLEWHRRPNKNTYYFPPIQNNNKDAVYYVQKDIDSILADNNFFVNTPQNCSQSGPPGSLYEGDTNISQLELFIHQPKLTFTGNSKFIFFSDISTQSLLVEKKAYFYDCIYSKGYNGRRGIDGVESIIQNGSISSMQSNHTMNSFWNETELEFWVDNAKVHTLTPNYSDRRLKEDFEDPDELFILDRLVKVPIYIFSYKDTGSDILNPSSDHIGFIADEIQPLFPDLPHLVKGYKNQMDQNNEPVYQSVNYNEITCLSLRAIQELHTHIKSLKEEIKQLHLELTYCKIFVAISFFPAIMIFFPKTVVLWMAFYAS